MQYRDTQACDMDGMIWWTWDSQAGRVYLLFFSKANINVLIYHGDQVKERQQSRDRKLSAKRTLKDLKD